MTGSIWHIPGATSTPTKGDLVFHSLATLLEFPLVTSDGERRPIRSFLFDDRSWLIRYLIVDAGRWYAPRRVVIPASEVEVPDWNNKIVPARMTRDQLLSSPDLDSVRPVSRQQQLAWNREFGWPDRDPYWCGPAAAGRQFRIQGKDDPHLRRTTDLATYEIWGKDGCLGILEGFFLRVGSWRIDYLLIRSGQWTFREKVVPTLQVVSISWAQHRVEVADRPRDASSADSQAH